MKHARSNRALTTTMIITRQVSEKQVLTAGKTAIFIVNI